MPYDTKIQLEFEAEMNVFPSYYFESMGEPAMELGEKELEKIGIYVRSHLPEWMGEVRRERELDLVERVVRVEAELKNLREVMEVRFNAVQTELKAFHQRFEDVNKRFEDVNTRFEDMDKRFSQIQWTMGIGFTLLAALMAVFNFY